MDNIAELLSLMGGVDRATSEQTGSFLTLGFDDLTTDEDRFIWARNELSSSDTQFASALKHSSKSARDSEKYRTEGNKYFKAELYKKALDLYTKSMIAAPAPDTTGNDDRHLAKSLCNRSATLFYLKEYTACLIDIEGALQAGYMEERQYLLYNRKVKCLHALHLDAEAKLAFDKAIDLLSKSKVGIDQQTRILKELEKHIESSKAVPNPHGQHKRVGAVDLPSLPHGANATHPCLSSSCKVMYNTEKGRYVVATRDIQPGEVVLVEKPYSSLLYKNRYEDFCWYCCGRLPIAPIACQHCTTVLFCSLSCRGSAWGSYHRYECSMGTGAEYHVKVQYHLALRTALMAGLDELLKYKDASTPPVTMLSDMSGCNGQGQYRSHDINTIHHMVHHSDKISKQEMREITSQAVKYTRCLEHLDFFQSIPPEENEAAILCVGKFLIGFIQAIKVNSASIQETVVCKGTHITDATYTTFGIGLYSTYSLFNHSCASNSYRISYTNNVVVHVSQRIREGEEVTALYTPGYLSYSREERQLAAQQSYHFNCSCEACVNNWPLFSAMRPQVTAAFKCKNCQYPLRPITGRRARAAKVCPGCRQRQDMPSIEAVLRESTRRKQEAVGLLSARKFKEAFTVMVREIERLEDLLVSPMMHQEFLLCVATLSKSFSLMGNMHIEE